jgi:hypothetical protein
MFKPDASQIQYRFSKFTSIRAAWRTKGKFRDIQALPQQYLRLPSSGLIFWIEYKAVFERMELDSECLHDKQIECICNETHLAYFKTSPRGLSTPWTRLSETGMPSGWWTDWPATISFHILLCKSGVWICWRPLPCHQCAGTTILQTSVLLYTALIAITVNTARSYILEDCYNDQFRK